MLAPIELLPSSPMSTILDYIAATFARDGIHVLPSSIPMVVLHPDPNAPKTPLYTLRARATEEGDKEGGEGEGKGGSAQ